MNADDTSIGRKLASVLVTPVIAGAVLTILAPFGTHAFSLLFRAVYWIGLCLAGGLGAMAAQGVLSRFAPSLSGWRHTLMQSLGATFAVAPFIILGFSGTSLLGIGISLFYIWVIAIVITTIGVMTAERKLARPEGRQTDANRPPIFDRLPPQLRDATLYAATSEDHYVRFFTSAGEHLTLMRLGDVEDLARPLPGVSPHRSWWVAESGVESVGKRDGKTVIHLKSGTNVPVSRAGAARIKKAGWTT